MKIQPSQLRRLHQLLNALGLMEEKQHLVRQYTNGRTSSSRDMMPHEASALIKGLEGLQKPQVQPYIPTAHDQAASADIMRKKIISMFREIGYEVYDPAKGKIVADMHRVYSFVKDKGYLKPKGLNQYTAKELPRLVSQVECIYSKTIDKLYA